MHWNRVNTIIRGLIVLLPLTVHANTRNSLFRVYHETPNSKSLVMVTGKNAAVWDGETGKIRFRITDHKEQIVRVGVSPDGTKALTCSFIPPNQFRILSKDNSIRLWDIKTGKPLLHIRNAAGGQFSNDGKRIYGFVHKEGAGPDNPSFDLAIWDSQTAQQLCTFVLRVPASPENPYFLQENSDGSKLLFCQRSTNVFDLKDLVSGSRVELDTRDRYGAFFSANGNEIQLGAYQQLRIFSAMSGKETKKFAYPGDRTLQRIAWTSDGQLLAGYDLYGNVLSYDHKTGKFTKSDTKVEVADIVRFCRDGKSFVINWGGPNSVPVQTSGFDAQTCKGIWTLRGWVVGLSGDDKAALVDERHLSIIHVPTGKVLRKVELEKSPGDRFGLG